MISKFKNQFKKTDLDEKNAFRQKVLNFLKEEFPAQNFIGDENIEIIKLGEIKLGLTNLRSNFLLTSQSDFELRKLVKEHFISLNDVFNSYELEEEPLWNDVKSKLMPQLMPIEFVSQMPIASFPFGDETAIGIVIDDEASYEYVVLEDLKSWSISKDELYQSAIDNLTEKSYDLEMTFVPPPNGIIVVDTQDGFDAVRILAPQMQEFFMEKLGEFFYFGIPNRDFLICWSKTDDKEFQNSIKKQIAEDFEERPYPLSKNIFEFDKNNGIKQLKDFGGITENWAINN